jgi:putative thioredoxin
MTKHAHIFDADSDTFKEKVLDASHHTPVLVDFSADWCGPCLALAPVLERVIPEYQGRLLCYKVDADENMKLCGHYRLRGFPTVLMFVNGEEVDRFTSAQPAPFVRTFIDRHLG